MELRRQRLPEGGRRAPGRLDPRQSTRAPPPGTRRSDRRREQGKPTSTGGCRMGAHEVTVADDREAPSAAPAAEFEPLLTAREVAARLSHRRRPRCCATSTSACCRAGGCAVDRAGRCGSDGARLRRRCLRRTGRESDARAGRVDSCAQAACIEHRRIYDMRHTIPPGPRRRQDRDPAPSPRVRSPRRPKHRGSGTPPPPRSEPTPPSSSPTPFSPPRPPRGGPPSAAPTPSYASRPAGTRDARPHAPEAPGAA